MALTVSQLQTDLDAVRAKIREVIGTGAQYSLVGSHSATQPQLKVLHGEERRLKAQIRRWTGQTRRTSPDFS